MNKLTVKQAADILNMDVQSLRVGIRQRAFPFGTAFKVGKRFTYFINPKEFEKFTRGENMSRLTYKSMCGDYGSTQEYESPYAEVQALRNALGRYEDLGSVDELIPKLQITKVGK